MRQMTMGMIGVLCCVVFGWLMSVSPAKAQEQPGALPEESSAESDRVFLHPVVVDGVELFKLRGSSALPADKRAESVAARIIEVAQRSETGTPFMDIQPGDFGLVILADGTRITVATQADAEAESFDIEVLASLQRDAIERAIVAYRENRSSEAFVLNALMAVVWSVVFALFCFVLVVVRKRFPRAIARRVKRYTQGVGVATGDVVKSDAIAQLVYSLMRLLLGFVFLIGLYYYLSLVLLSFPETKPIAQILINNVTNPVLSLLRSFVGYLPNLITIAVLAYLARLLLKTIRLFFQNLEAGVITWKGFEKEWIWPTYNLLQITIILMTLVLCFPYIPGADSAAFQGLTIFVGVVLSLGSNTVVANMLAGLFVLYKRSMRIGDRIRVGDHYGDVIEIKLMETYIKSVKNELVSIPNSTLISSEVVNYSSKIDGRGLILHSTVGIGYEEPREKIEAMLVEAARRTPGLKKNPVPFVLMDGLGDFGINYQINAFTTRGSSLPLLRSQLHKNIVDVFNENEVAIMTPAYEGDPEEPKVAPPVWEGELAPNARIAPEDASEKKA